MLTPLSALAAQPLVLSSGTDSFRLGGSNIDILEDKAGKLTITDVVSPQYATSYKQSKQLIPNFGVTDSVFWFRFTIDHGQSDSRKWFLFVDNSLMDEANLFVPLADGSFTVNHAGISTFSRNSAERKKGAILPLPAGPVPCTFFLRAHEPGRAVFPLAIMTREALDRTETVETSLMAGFGGIMLTVFFLASLLFMMLKEREYLAFMLVVLFTALFNLMTKGYLHPLLPESAIRHYHIIVAWLVCITILANISFSRRFLRGKDHAPRADLLLSWCCYLIIIIAAAVPALTPSQAFRLISNFSAVTILLMIWIAVTAWRNGFTPALYYLIPYGVMIAGSVWMKLVTMTVLPYNLVANNFQTLHSVIYVLFICLAFGANFRGIARRNNELINDLQTEVEQRSTANQALEEEIATRKRLEREIVRISDNERRSISHELHDGICQQLTAARLRFSALEDKFADAGLQTDVLPLGRLLYDTVNHANRLSRGLWATDANGRGSSLNMEDLTRELAEQSGIPIKLAQRQHCVSCVADNLAQVQLIAREALVNAVKHSRASNITVRLECDQQGKIFLEVRDNGCGLGSRENTNGGMGINIIKHRAGMIGATLHIDDAEGGGTVVSCSAKCTAVSEAST